MLAAALLIVLISAGCAGVDSADLPASTAQAENHQTELAGTVAAQVAMTVEALVQTPAATPLPATATPTTAASPSPTPQPLTIAVSVNTNCRSGPAANYDYRGVLLSGESANVVAASSVESYWYIENPDLPGERCWLWDEYATLEGDPSGLPRYTPEPSPTPALDFVLFLNNIRECGSDNYVHLTFQNTGGTAFVSGQITLTDLDTGGQLYGPLVDRHPFAAGPLCPPDHGNYVGPGTAAYISIPFGASASGHYARATIRACTMDHAGGQCLTKTIDFQVP